MNLLKIVFIIQKWLLHAKVPIWKTGDFITAPNISKIFSEMILIWIISYWKNIYKNKKINIVELGTGNGEMMFQIINTSKIF